jgi:hypothetical protein
MKIAIGILALALTAFGQTTLTCSGPCGGSSGTAGAITATWNNASNAVWVDNNGMIISGAGVVGNTRKPKTPLMTIALVRNSAKPLPATALAPSTYLKLAASIGLSSAATDEARLTMAISDLGLKVYDFNKVDEYLFDQAYKINPNTRWVWKPMREADMHAIAAVSPGGWISQRSGMGTVESKQYAQKIPAGVLATIGAVLEKMPDAVFMVSDYETVKPDPFLCVTTGKLAPEGKIWIISQWDEPGFSDGELIRSTIKYEGVQ